MKNKNFVPINFLLLQFSGLWHWQYHNWNEYDDDIFCPAITFSDAAGISGRVTTFALDSRWA